MAKKLVIVESPSKAKTIEKILGNQYEVYASYGHVIDLPKSTLGIDIENNYEPKYKTIKGKGELLKKLKTKAKKADEIYLASDLDREGEAIAWHISNYIKLPEKTKRIEFNEITKTAVKKAVENPREINENLVDAQQARRLLDRIVGYKISPLLWSTINKSASAGRVQSVTLKLICDLEDEIKSFVPKIYWEVSSELEKGIKLNLSEIKEEKIDRIYDEDVMKKLKKDLKNKDLVISDVTVKEKKQSPPQPFKTSTLQQLASSYLGYGASKTMRIAQQLYEGLDIFGETKGLITYIRTDSTRISDDAVNSARAYITENYGKEYIGYNVKKKAKGNIQDAHEGIRPSYIDYDPEKIKSFLTNDQYKLYKLIWERFLVSQFAGMKYNQMQINAVNSDYKFKGSINQVTFDGYYKIFKDPEEIKTGSFPKIEKDDVFKIEKLDIKEGITKAPTRFSEASLVKKLESEGIGRPSTYASIIETLKSKEYVEIIEKRIHPTLFGYEVKKELEKNFKKIMDIKFTASMETELDKIELGETEWKELLDKFYKDLEKSINKYEEFIEELKNRRIESDIFCSNEKDKMILKTGRFGKYLVCEVNPEEKISIKNIELSEEEIEKGKIYIKEQVEKILEEKRGLKTNMTTENGKMFLLKKGRFGDYLESEDYEEDNIRMSLSVALRSKLKKNEIALVDGVLQIKEEVLKELEIDRKIIEEAGKCEKCGRIFEIKTGRFGKFLACSGYPECKNIKQIAKKGAKKSTKKVTKKKTKKTVKK